MNRNCTVEEKTRCQSASPQPWIAPDDGKPQRFGLIDVLAGLCIVGTGICFLIYLMSASGGDLHRMVEVLIEDIPTAQLAGVAMVLAFMACGTTASRQARLSGSAGPSLYSIAMVAAVGLVVIFAVPALLGV